MKKKNITRLTDKVANLILDGVKTFGGYNPDEVLPFVEEHMTVTEFEDSYNFLKWCQANKKRFGTGTIKERWLEWQKTLC